MKEIKTVKEIAQLYVDAMITLDSQQLSAESQLKARAAIEGSTTFFALLNIAQSLENISDYCAAKINEVK